MCPDGSQVSVWGIMRKAIGKDLSKISLPVILNEPLGILQVNYFEDLQQQQKTHILMKLLK